VRSYVEHSPEGYRHVIASPFVRGVPAPVWGDLPAVHLDWDTSSPLRAVRSLAHLRRWHPFDVVHAHSSFPGAYVRSMRWSPRIRVVYTPHCFAFSRTDVGALRRAAFRGIEAALAGRSAVAACGSGEKEQALSVGARQKTTVVIPNLASLGDVDADPGRREDVAEVLRVGMLGRWSAQKDPDYFTRRIQELRGALPRTRVEATWIGDGPDDAPAGIRVTGWLSREDVRANLQELDVYVHTAAWEGFPIALLDAHAVGLPILARPIPALPNLPAMLSIDDGLARLSAALADRRFVEWSASNREAWSRYLGPRDVAAQRRALALAWG